MRYHIRHQTNYFYNQPVILSPHLLRLRPKSDGGQTLREFTLKINPEPLTITNIIDLDGNSCLQIWFNQPTEELLIDVVSEGKPMGLILFSICWNLGRPVYPLIILFLSTVNYNPTDNFMG